MANIFDSLKNGVVNFSYVKKSTGEVRNAVGTLNMAVAVENGALESEVTKAIEGYDKAHKYFDLEKKAWRTFTGNVTVL